MKVTGRGVAAVAWGVISGGTGFIGSIAKKLPNPESRLQKMAMGTAFHLTNAALFTTGIVAAPFTLGTSLGLSGSAVAAEIGYAVTARRDAPERDAEMLDQRQQEAEARFRD